jgi:hypothetical protein
MRIILDKIQYVFAELQLLIFKGSSAIIKFNAPTMSHVSTLYTPRLNHLKALGLYFDSAANFFPQHVIAEISLGWESKKIDQP